MARVFITGSTTGLGLLSAKALIRQGHQVVLHARNDKKRKDVLAAVTGAEDVLIADLSSVEETKQLAARANASGRFDSIVHNAGVYQASGKMIFTVNTLAPYILTCLMHQPARMIYLSSGMHLQGDPLLKEAPFLNRSVSYADSKLHNLVLAKAVARKWKGIFSNAVDPGWVPTQMGGPGAPDSLQEGIKTQVWLAVSNDVGATVTGRYFHQMKEGVYRQAADDSAIQNRLLHLCERVTGVFFP